MKPFVLAVILTDGQTEIVKLSFKTNPSLSDVLHKHQFSKTNAAK